jgi:DNA-directed RNA polymerase subunit omega
MIKYLLDELPDGFDSKYRLVIVGAKRSRQINRGAQPLVNTKALKPTLIALDEIYEGAVRAQQPLPDWEDRHAKQVAQETRAAWFRHIPPEELIPATLAPDEVKVAGVGYEVEERGEEFGEYQAELVEGQEHLEGELEEFDPISGIVLEEGVEGVEIEGGKEVEG